MEGPLRRMLRGLDGAHAPAGPAEKPSEKYIKAAKLATALAPKTHYTVDEKQKSILITDDGYEAAEDVLGVARPPRHRLLHTTFVGPSLPRSGSLGCSGSLGSRSLADLLDAADLEREDAPGQRLCHVASV